jgi:hypothetical protein
MILTINTDDSYFPIQHLLTGICSEYRVLCSLWGRYWSFTYNLSVIICRAKWHRSCRLHRRKNTCKHARSRAHTHTHTHSVRTFIPPPHRPYFLDWDIWGKEQQLPIPVVALSKAGIRPLAFWNRGFESRRGMDVCPLWMLCRVGSSLCDGPINRPGSVPSVCVCVWSNAAIILCTYSG